MLKSKYRVMKLKNYWPEVVPQWIVEKKIPFLPIWIELYPGPVSKEEAFELKRLYELIDE